MNIYKLCRRSTCILIFTCTVLLLFMSSEEANGIATSRIEDTALQTAEQVQAYWTAERMRNAIPIPLPEVVTPADGLSTVQQESRPDGTLPRYASGWDPGSGLPQPDPRIMYSINEGHPLFQRASGGVSPQVFGTAPTDPLNGPYAPFQRWTWYGDYTKQNTKKIGKLFFTDGVSNYVCSASVIGPSTIATAGHCLAKGDGTWYTGYLFCPSYYRGSGAGAPYPTRGCWSWRWAATTSPWQEYGIVDRDVGCIVTALTGDTVSNTIGNVTGWTGRAANWVSEQYMFAWGYPAVSPFPGYHIITAASPEMYEVNMYISDGQVSKYIGNDMTGGSSGGPWWMSVSHQTAEYSDTDNLPTDPPAGPGLPGGPYINGVNSHKRCEGSCFTPPTASAGLYWQEMGSPQFNDTGDGEESEDVFQTCFDLE